MRRRPLPFEFDGKGVVDLVPAVENGGSAADSGLVASHLFKRNLSLDSVGFAEPTSVLDSARISSVPSSSSTLSSSFGGGGGGAGGVASTDTATNSYPRWLQDFTIATGSIVGGVSSEHLLPVFPSHEIGTVYGWESVLSESVDASPIQEQSVLRWITGDVEPQVTASLNEALPICGSDSTAAAFESGGGLGVIVQGFDGEINRSGNEEIGFPSGQIASNHPPNSQKFIYHHPSVNSTLEAVSLHPQASFDSSETVRPMMLANQQQIQQAQNPPFFSPLTSYSHHQEKNLFIHQQAVKSNNSGFNGGVIIEPHVKILKGSYTDTGQQEILHPQFLQHGPMRPEPKPNISGVNETGTCQEQMILDQLYESAELFQSGNPLLAQGILARLNHQLSPIDKPFHRAAFYLKEAMQLLLHTTNNLNPPLITSSPFNLFFSISAYKSFSEISPIIQFANFTCNQAFLEALDGYSSIHIVDFDIGYGGQWASLIQELALRCDSLTFLKITAVFNSFSIRDQIDVELARENLVQFANEVNIALEFEVMNINSLHISENEVIAVNLPISSLTNHQLSLPLVLHFVKQLSPRIIVSIDRGYYRTDLSLANRIIHALQSYSAVLESLDAARVNADVLQNIERFLLQPGIEKLVMGQYCFTEKTQPWREVFMSSGFFPVTFSSFTESQAECVVKRSQVRGFEIEKRQSSLVLCWQRKDLVSASAWRC